MQNIGLFPSSQNIGLFSLDSSLLLPCLRSPRSLALPSVSSVSSRGPKLLARSPKLLARSLFGPREETEETEGKARAPREEPLALRSEKK